MRVLAFALLAIGRCSAAAEVVVLSDKTFDETVSDGSFWLIEFYAPWCGHCKKLKPVWEQLVAHVDGDVVVAEVDATKEAALAQRLSVDSYPSLLLFRDGDMYRYMGERADPETLADFVHTGYASQSPEWYVGPWLQTPVSWFYIYVNAVQAVVESCTQEHREQLPFDPELAKMEADIRRMVRQQNGEPDDPDEVDPDQTPASAEPPPQRNSCAVNLGISVGIVGGLMLFIHFAISLYFRYKYDEWPFGKA
jgi:protein disulfide-isomerase-like protein